MRQLAEQVNETEDSKPQLELFVREQRYANALNFLHTIPRFDRRKMNWVEQRKADDPVREYKTIYKNVQYTIRVTGANIKRKGPDGKLINTIMWPSDREEKVEMAILKVASEGGITEIKTDSARGYGCYFSIFSIKELTGMNANDIKEAIEVLHKSNLDISHEFIDGSGEAVIEDMSSTFLPIRYMSSVSGHRNDKCYIIFHPSIRAAIDSLAYRPYLYKKTDSHKKGLTRYLHKRLIIRYIYAAKDQTYHFNLRTLMNDFGKTPLNETITETQLKNLGRDVNLALADLIKSNVILPDFTKERIENNANKPHDYKYTISAHPEFVKEQRASNAIVKNIKELHPTREPLTIDA